VAEWEFAQRDKSEQLARLHHFAMTKTVADGDIEFIITVYEYLTPKDPAMKFLARGDKQLNQKTAAFNPCGWGLTMIQALTACMDMIRKFPYEA
jgi:hypothetical protein